MWCEDGANFYVISESHYHENGRLARDDTYTGPVPDGSGRNTTSYMIKVVAYFEDGRIKEIINYTPTKPVILISAEKKDMANKLSIMTTYG
jgi:hypothetical protein